MSHLQSGQAPPIKMDWLVAASRSLDSSSVGLLVLTILAFLIPFVIILPPVPLQKSDALLQTHTKAGLDHAKSNLKNQLSSSEHGAKPGKAPKIQSLMIYPVKSCRGIEITKSKVLPTGLEFDRLFTFAQLKSPFPVSLNSTVEEKTKHEWKFITQREFPRLATVKVDLWLPDQMKLRKQSMSSTEAFVILRFPWREDGWRGLWSVIGAKLARGLRAVPEREILLPVDYPGKADIEELGYKHEDVTIWKDTVSALNMERELPQELSLYLGVSNRLAIFRIDPSKLREVYRCAPRKDSAGYQPITGFQDAYPLHILNLSSMQDFDVQVPKDENLKHLDVRRFRANIILSGLPAYEEETWKTMRFRPGNSGLYNDARFHVSCRTVRCKMPNVDPDSGIKHSVEPDKSLRKLRNVDEGAPVNGCLGMQMTPLFDATMGDDRASWLGVGMDAEVEETGQHVYIKQ